MWSGWSCWGGARGMHCRTLHYGELSKLKRVWNDKEMLMWLCILKSRILFKYTTCKWSELRQLWNSGDDVPLWTISPGTWQCSVCVCITCLRQCLNQSQASVSDHQPIRAEETAWTPGLANQRPVLATLDQWEARKLRRAVWHYPGAVLSVRLGSDQWTLANLGDGVTSTGECKLVSADNIQTEKWTKTKTNIFTFTIYCANFCFNSVINN